MTTYKMSELLARYPVDLSYEMTDRNPHMDPDGSRMDHWRVRLRHQGRTYTFTFSKGSGHKGAPPEVSEVLECLATAASGIDSCAGFEDWASDLGMDPDSRKAERTYKACNKARASLERLLGPEGYETLLKVER